MPRALTDGGDPVPGEKALFGIGAGLLLAYLARVLARAKGARARLARQLADLGGDD
jgi:hypothetical protein